MVRSGKIIHDYFSLSDKKYIQDNFSIAINAWAVHINKKVREVNNINKANLIARFKFLEDDGIGGDLARANPPPVAGQKFKPVIAFDLADCWEMVRKRDKPYPNFSTVALHELGHALAGLRHDDSRGIMNSAYKYRELQIDDICGIKAMYNYFSKFDFNGRSYVWISKYSKANRTINFKDAEFVSKCKTINDDGHFLALETINAIQYVRTYYECPIQILSTFRDPVCNANAGGASLSQHILRNAVDWKFVGPNARKAQERFESDINNKRIPLYVLLQLGITGFGTYPYGYGTNHFDCRNDKQYNRWYSGMGYVVWGEFARSGSWYDPVAEFKAND